MRRAGIYHIKQPEYSSTWTGTPNRPPKFDRGFTGHEHLYDFGLINMNGRMYDPLLSSFLSPDNYMQDPTSQQGFNRYAYCMYNPLKYVDPSGNRYYGYDESYMYRVIDEITQQVLHEWYSVYDIAVASVQLTINMACGLYSHGLDTHGNGSGHGGGAMGGKTDRKAIEAFLKKYKLELGQPIPENLRTSDFLIEFQETFFPDAPMEYVQKFVVEFNNALFYSFNSDGELVINSGKTSNLFKKDFSLGISNVYFNGNYAFNSPEDLFYAIGHELIHVSQNILLAGYPKDFLTAQAFFDVKEHWAYSWQTGAGDIVHYSVDTASLTTYSNYANPLNPSIMVDYTNMMNYRNFKWLQNVIYPPF